MSLINRTTILDNGVTVSTISMRDSKKAAFQVVAEGGQSTGAAGVAHFVEHMLFQGTTMRTAQQLADDFKSLGFGDLNGSTSLLRSLYPSYSMAPYSCSENAFYPALQIILDLIANPKFLDPNFDVSILEGERNRILEEESTARTKHADFYMWQSALFPQTHRARTPLGQKTDVERISLQNIIDYYHANYTGKRLFLFAAGPIDHDRIVNISNEYLKKLPSGTPFTANPIIAAPAEMNTPKLLDVEGIDLWIETFEKLSKHTKSLSKLMPNKNGKIATLLRSYPNLIQAFKRFANNSSKQIDLGLTWPGALSTDEKKAHLTSTTVSVLDAMLNQKGIIEDKLVYVINAGNMSDKDTGTITIASNFDPNKTSKVLELIGSSLTELISSPQKNLLDIARNEQAQYWETYEPTAVSLTARMRNSLINGGRYITDDEYLELISQVRPDDIRNTAAEIFVREKTAVRSHGAMPARSEILPHLFPT